MKTSVILADQISHYESAINSHLPAVFCAPINVEINDEFVCAVIIENKGKIVACAFAYGRIMAQGDIHFKAGILGGVAVGTEYRGQGLGKAVVQKLDSYLASNVVLHSFLFAYEPKIYHSSGCSNLDIPIHYFDKQQQTWNKFVYRGGMVKSYTQLQLADNLVIEFKVCVY